MVSKPLLLPSILLLLISVIMASVLLSTHQNSKKIITTTMNEEAASKNVTPFSEIFGVKIHRNPPHSKLDQLQVTTWPKWSAEPSKIPWIFKAEETMYLLEGKVKVSVKGHEGSFEIGAGDLVVFPIGMEITWEILEAVTKHYHVEK